MPRLLCLLLVCTLIAGCRVQFVIPVRGGYVVIAEQRLVLDFNEASGFRIEVRNFNYDQTFFAIPQPGYAFSHWNGEGDNLLCGGSSKPCRLQPGLLRGNSQVEDILRSDEVFFLEPVFVRIVLPVTDQPYGGRCINSEMWSVGSIIESEYIERDLQTGESFHLRFHQQVEQGVTEPPLLWELTEGSNTLRTTLDVTNEQTGESFRNVFASIFNYVPDGFRVRHWGEYGMALDDDGQTGFSLLTWFEPPFVERFGFREGRGSEQEFTRMESGFDRGVPVGEREVGVMKYKEFLGYATVDTLSGRHNTCHFREVVYETLNGQTSTNETNSYYRINDGILIYQDRANGRIERELFLPASINARIIRSL